MEKNLISKYTDDFKKGIVSQYKNCKTFRQISTEYGVGLSAFSRWFKQFDEVKTEDGSILTAQQIKQLQKEKLQLQE